MSLADGGHLTKRQMRRKLTETKKVVRELEVEDALTVQEDMTVQNLTTLGTDYEESSTIFNTLVKVHNADNTYNYFSQDEQYDGIEFLHTQANTPTWLK